MDNHSILLVDDEAGLIEMLKKVLKKEGFIFIDSALTGAVALNNVKNKQYDLIILDVMLPDIEGFELCREIRKFTYAPIIFLTARTSELDMITGFGTGGDDYITKPFSPLEVVARIKAHFRRKEIYETQKTGHSQYIKIGELEIDKNSAIVQLSKRTIELTAKEFELLVFFAEHPNQIFTITQLYEKVWGMDSLGDDQTVKVHIMRLRKKLESDSKNPKLIQNVRGLGYKLNAKGE
ncbi:response regulator transcription factor [Clostridium beijerinckii]|uniref:Stage 0 sporulation protein A homolog n=1 Tax=Clostridium beijerinckii TaxID=1520 RepID=A0A1S8S9R5_CLOBE|nr:response regulator transcription factor [Clostridium beijerinckii]NMF04190.1 response regulator transcription factor [Clostridium beijerinckii]NRY60618.1 DNA-binding response OmpR family regulator [Clostridium beijerinckii]OOM61985.1 transcriptional regulatory protein YycF [Clostridium beijerinckii]